MRHTRPPRTLPPRTLVAIPRPELEDVVQHVQRKYGNWVTANTRVYDIESVHSVKTLLKYLTSRFCGTSKKVKRQITPETTLQELYLIMYPAEQSD